MARRKTHGPLRVLINNRPVGRLEKETSGAILFRYVDSWLDWEHRFPVSLSLPLKTSAYRGAEVTAVFDNLLPDSDAVRRRVAERTGAEGSDPYSLLERIGRDCVGAMQFIPDDVEIGAAGTIEGEVIDDAAIAAMLADLKQAPLGIDQEHAFRISVAGAQEKTALLKYNGQWMRPLGTTPTTHIFKPQIGTFQTSTGTIDLSNSVDNEHYCLKLLAAFGLAVAHTEIATFGARKVLVVERFDRQWLDDGRLLRLPQEDCCQALGVPSSKKYQQTVIGGVNGPSAVQILRLLQASDTPLQDQAAFFKSLIIFWLIGATDGHAKNFSIFLRPGGGFGLTPFYDVLSAQPAYDARQIPQNKFKLAMSIGNNRKYAIPQIHGRHFVETGKEAGLGPAVIRKVFEETMDDSATVADRAFAQVPDAFDRSIYDSISAAIAIRAPQLATGLAELKG